MVDGLTTKFGLSRDWRLTKNTWQYRYAEFIEPLNAVAPWGRALPADNALADFDLYYNAKFREWHATGNPTAKGLLFYDGAVYPAWTHLEDFLGYARDKAERAYLPNFVLNLKRWTPPPEQGIIPQAAVQLPATYGGEAAYVGLWLPYASDDYRRAFLHCYVGEPEEAYNVLTEGWFLSEGPSTGANSQGMHEETWFFEYLEVWRDADGVLYGEGGEGRTFYCSHILVRLGTEAQDWWHYMSHDLRLTTGKWGLSFGGAQQWANITPITYGSQTGYPLAIAPSLAYPTVPKPLPDVSGVGGDADAWNDDPTWGALVTDVAGWTVTTTEATDATQRPLVTMTPATAAQHIRPVVWLATEQHPAIIGDETESEDVTTAGTHALKSMRLSFNSEYKGQSGSVTFHPSEEDDPRFPTFRENAACRLSIGWQTGAGAGIAVAETAHLYVRPGGVTRGRDGDMQTAGAPWLTLDLGDFADVRASRKQIIDVRQAAGMTIGEWTLMAANRMGIQSDYVYCDPALEDIVIPTNIEIPGTPVLAPQDGAGWLDHIREVERDASIRVGFNRPVAAMGGAWYTMVVDAGMPEYEHGVSAITYTLEADALTDSDVLYTVKAQASAEDFRNVLKASYGRKRSIRAGAADNAVVEWYWAEPLATRKLTVGDDWGVAITDTNATAPGEIAQRFALEHYKWQGKLFWTGPLRNDIKPDDFIAAGDLPGIDVDKGSVWQVVSVDMEANFADLDGELSVAAVLVYPN